MASPPISIIINNFTMKALDPFSTIESVMNDTVSFGEQRVYQPSQFEQVNYVAVLAYGRHNCKVIRKEQYMLIRANDVMGMYTQSIPIPTVMDWLCCELQEPFGEFADIVSLAVAYFALLYNHRNGDDFKIDLSIVRADVLRYCLFYYLLRVDINMDRWASIQVREHCDTRDRFVYMKTLDYVQQLSEYTGTIDRHLKDISPTDPILESFYPMVTIVTTFVSADLRLALDLA
jgi:hypothetical protein